MKKILILGLFLGQQVRAQDVSLFAKLPADTKQILWVASSKNVHSKAQRWILSEGHWEKMGEAIPVVVGRSGTLNGGQNREGDGATPEGIYPLTEIFGRQTKSAFHLPYTAIQPDDKWIDDPRHPDYNKWIRGPTTAKSFENLWRRDDLYDDFAVIGFNRNPIVPGRGSAIFMHTWRSPDKGTAGCVAMKKENLREVLAWLVPESRPHIVIGN